MEKNCFSVSLSFGSSSFYSKKSRPVKTGTSPVEKRGRCVETRCIASLYRTCIQNKMAKTGLNLPKSPPPEKDLCIFNSPYLAR
jgi:hypothetical protein